MFRNCVFLKVHLLHIVCNAMRCCWNIPKSFIEPRSENVDNFVDEWKFRIPSPGMRSRAILYRIPIHDFGKVRQFVSLTSPGRRIGPRETLLHWNRPFAKSHLPAPEQAGTGAENACQEYAELVRAIFLCLSWNPFRYGFRVLPKPRRTGWQWPLPSRVGT